MHELTALMDMESSNLRGKLHMNTYVRLKVKKVRHDAQPTDRK